MMLRLYARKCTVKEITPKECDEFTSQYHKQGVCTAPINYGLFYQDELVQIMSFGNDRYGLQAHNCKYQYEMYRECSKKDCYVLGGKSKLLKHFIEEKNPYNIISYCSLEGGFDGHSYYLCGFNLVRKQEGSYHYERNGVRYSRFQFQKNSTLREKGQKENIQKTIESVGGTYNWTLTEKENATLNGFVRVEEKGNLVFELNLKPYKGYIYKTTNLINGKIYVGQHRSDEFDSLYYGSGTLFLRALAKYGKENFKVEVLEWVGEETYYVDFQRKINELEIKHIEANNSTDLEIGYNLTEGGSAEGFTMSAIKTRSSLEYKKLMSERQKLLWQDPEFRKAHEVLYSDSARKEKLSRSIRKFWENNEEARKRHSELTKKRYQEHPMTDETKQKISQSGKNRDPIWIEKYRKSLEKYRQEHPDYLEKLSERAKKYYLEHPETFIQSDETKQKIAQTRIKRNRNQESSDFMKEKWKEQEYRDKWYEGMARTWTEEKRQETSQKMQEIVQTDEWKEKHRKAIDEKVKGNEEFSQKMSEVMKEVYKDRQGATAGMKWWNNGEKSMQCKEYPGDGWVPGRLAYEGLGKTKGSKVWNNGIENKMSVECLGPEWVLGMLRKKKNDVKVSRKGKIWWTNGVENKIGDTCPGDGWWKGMTKTYS